MSDYLFLKELPSLVDGTRMRVQREMKQLLINRREKMTRFIHIAMLALVVLSECSMSRFQSRNIHISTRLQQYNDINRIALDSDNSDLLFKAIADSERCQIEAAIWKATRKDFQVNAELDLFAEKRRPIYRDDDPKYLIQFRADISSLGQKKINNHISNGDDIISLTNVTIAAATFPTTPKLKSVGRKKSWKSPFRSNELQRNINFLHNLNEIQTHRSGDATAVVEAIYLDADGLVAATLIQKAAMMIDKEYPVHSVSSLTPSSSSPSSSASFRAAASLSNCVRAIFTSASRVAEPSNLFCLDRTKQEFMRILRHCVRYADLKSAIPLLAVYHRKGIHYDADVSQLVFGLMDIGIRRGLYMDSAILYSVTGESCNGSAAQLQFYHRQGSIAHLRSLMQLHLVDDDINVSDLSASKYRDSGSTSGTTNKDIIRANIVSCKGLLQLLRSTSSSDGGDENILLMKLFEQEMVHILLDDRVKELPFQEIPDLSSNTDAVSSFHADVLDTLYMAAAEENRRIFLLTAATAIKIGISLTDEDITLIRDHLD